MKLNLLMGLLQKLLNIDNYSITPKNFVILTKILKNLTQAGKNAKKNKDEMFIDKVLIRPITQSHQFTNHHPPINTLQPPVITTNKHPLK